MHHATRPAGESQLAEAVRPFRYSGPDWRVFAAPNVLIGPNGSAAGTNIAAGGEPGEQAITTGSSPIESVWWRSTAPSSGTLEVRVTGQRNSASSGARIDVDAFVRWP